MGSQKPRIRILRHLARTGGTLITKCLGSMDKVVVLSEVHPAVLNATDPMKQAVEWFGLVSKKQMLRWRNLRGPRFEQFVWARHDAAESRGEHLVLRDWSHLDYYGKPFIEKPLMGSGLRDSLTELFEIIEACTVRHPIDQYLSLGKIAAIPEIDWELFLDGNLAFAKYALECGFVRYEDLTSDPDGKLRELCGMLKLDFDPKYAQRWASYTTVTGDIGKQGGGRGAREVQIKSFKRKAVDEGLVERFRSDARYQETCQLLGYEV